MVGESLSQSWVFLDSSRSIPMYMKSLPKPLFIVHIPAACPTYPSSVIVAIIGGGTLDDVTCETVPSSSRRASTRNEGRIHGLKYDVILGR